MSNRKNCCEAYNICFNHDSWYCDECVRNKNMIDYLDIRVEPRYEGEFDEFHVQKDIDKHKIQEAQKRLLYDDDEYLQIIMRGGENHYE